MTTTRRPTTPGNVTLNGAAYQSSAAGGTISFTGPVIAAANASVTTANNNISFSSTIDDAAANTHGLTLTAGTGAITVGSNIGAVTQLLSLTFVSGTATISGTLGLPSPLGTLTITAGTVNIQGNNFDITTLSVANGATLSLDGTQATQTIGNAQTTGTISYYNAGTIHHAQFFNLTIAGPGTTTLAVPLPSATLPPTSAR